MINNIFIKRVLIVAFEISISSALFAQTQYDYYDDSAVAGGADRVLNIILIIVILVIIAFILLLIISGAMNVYYWLNPKANQDYKRAEGEKEKETEVIYKKELKTKIEAQKNNIEIVEEIKSPILTEKEIEVIIEPSKADNENKKGDPSCEYGFPYYTADNKKFLYLNTLNGLDYPQHPNSILKILEGTEVICSNAIRSDYLLKLVLPKTLLYIGNKSINCKSIKEIVLPESLQYIGDSAFYGCNNLQEFVIPQSLTHIGTFALSNTGIKNIINYSAKFKIIGGCLYDEKLKRLIKFFGSDTKIDVPESVEDITGAFTGCNNLEQVTLSPKIKIIGERTFMGCTNLREVIIPKGITAIDRCAFVGCKNLRKIVIPEGLRFIGEMCFEGCQNLRYVVLPSTIEQIGDDEFNDFEIFGGCISLSYIFIPKGAKEKFVSYFSENLLVEENPETFFEKKTQDSAVLSNTDLNTTITEKEIREGWSDEYGVRYSADGKKLLFSTQRLKNTINYSKIRHYKVKSGTVVICDYAFESGELVSIELPDTIVKIGNSVFSECRNLRHINIPKNLNYFGESVFKGCSSLQHIDIPASIQLIRKSMFCDCSSLKLFIIPPVVKEIQDSAFYGCSSLYSLFLPDGVEFIGNKAFGACDRLDEMVLPSSVRAINGNPFTATILTGKYFRVICKSSSYKVENRGLYTSDKKVLIACLSNDDTFDVLNGVTTIGDSAFSENRRLQSVKLPSSLLEIDNNAFRGCKFETWYFLKNWRFLEKMLFGVVGIYQNLYYPKCSKK